MGLVFCYAVATVAKIQRLNAWFKVWQSRNLFFFLENFSGTDIFFGNSYTAIYFGQIPNWWAVTSFINVYKTECSWIATYPWYTWLGWHTIDNLHISHNASGKEADIRVVLIRNSSRHSSLDITGLELPCLAANMCFARLRYQGSSLKRSWCYKMNLSKNVNWKPLLRSKIQPFLDILGKGSSAKIFSKGM